MQRQRNIEAGGAILECTFYGSGTPVVLLANAGCSTGYFDDLARVLAAGGLQTISVNMRGAGESRGSLDGITVHDLAADVAGVLEAVDWVLSALAPASITGPMRVEFFRRLATPSEPLRCGEGSGTCGSWRRPVDWSGSGNGGSCAIRHRHDRIRQPIVGT